MLIIQLCEIDLSDLLPSDSLRPFLDEIKKREKHRKQIAKKVSHDLCNTSKFVSS